MILKMSRALFLGLVIILGITLGPSTVLAQFYRWVDEQGTAHFAEESVAKCEGAADLPIIGNIFLEIGAVGGFGRSAKGLK